MVVATAVSLPDRTRVWNVELCRTLPPPPPTGRFLRVTRIPDSGLYRSFSGIVIKLAGFPAKEMKHDVRHTNVSRLSFQNKNVLQGCLWASSSWQNNKEEHTQIKRRFIHFAFSLKVLIYHLNTCR